MHSKTLVSQRVLHRSSLLLRLYQVPVVGFSRCCCGCCLFIFCSTHLGQCERGLETVEQELLNNPLTPLNNLLTYLGQCERGIETVEWDLITPGRKTQQFGSKVLIKGDGKVKEEGEKEGGRRRKTKKVMHTISKKVLQYILRHTQLDSRTYCMIRFLASSLSFLLSSFSLSLTSSFLPPNRMHDVRPITTY